MSRPPHTGSSGAYNDDDLTIPPFRPRPTSAHGESAYGTSPSSPAPAPQRTATKQPAQLDHKPENRLGHYQIIKTVGEGSFGKVKLAIHEETGQKVALKMISRRNLTSKDMAGRVEREIAYLQLLRHPHIIKLFTVITTPQEIIMVIEYAGGELFEFLVTNGKMPEDSARRFFQQIICAVEYCHRHKIVHRDLKPENLLLDSNLNVKIADFGLSNIMTDGNFLKTSCGSPNYAAPEVIGGKLYAGPEVDVWSCGVILFVLLCGKLPFDDDYIPNLFKKISQGKYSMPAYLTPEAKDLISKMLIVNPLHRITIQEIRKHPWFKKNLPEYLHPPKEEFFDTGVDITKLPQLEDLERGPAMTLKGPLHDDVVSKLGVTMGYPKDDIQDALTKNEPSAIKDAYMIVRENTMMIPRLSVNTKNDGFTAQSPPAWDSPAFPPSPRVSQSPMSAPHWGNNHNQSRTGSPLMKPNTPTGLGISTAPEPERTSSIGILPSSMPAYHAALMSGAALPPHQPSHSGMGPGSSNFTPVLTNPPATAAKRPKPTKWQFGIRSRNAPLEAVSCIYRALKRLGAEWVDHTVPEPREPRQRHGSGDGEDGEEDEKHDEDEETEGDNKKPKDPWIIQARWRKIAKIPTTDHPRSQEPGPAVREVCTFVHLTIQLYQLEHDNYLVDFKCAGYEPEKKPTKKKRVGFEEVLGGDSDGKLGRGGQKEDYKEVNSPFPFLDAAGALIVALAEAGD